MQPMGLVCACWVAGLMWIGWCIGPGAANNTRDASGHYGFLSYFGVTPAEIIEQVDEMFGVGIVDIQFYDWFDNYAGQHQSFVRNNSRGKDPKPEWWRADKWTDPWDSHLTVRRDTLRAAIQRVRERGGRSWAYLQAVGSEYWDLAGSPDDDCANPFDHSLQNASLVKRFHLTICKLRNQTAWVVQESPKRVFPAYFMSYDLGIYQSQAWIPIVKELGFSGIHWDTLGVKAADYFAESFGVQAFVTATKPLIAAAGLQQTLNQVDTHWWDRLLFSSGTLAFPYSEIWSHYHEDLFWERTVGLRGAVIANYPGTKMNGCCCITASDCHLCTDAAVYDNCPANITQDQLLQIRWEKTCSTGARYVVLGNGLKRLVTEFFPWTVPVSNSSLALIRRSNCSNIVRMHSGKVDGSSHFLRVLLLTSIPIILLLVVLFVCIIAQCAMSRKARAKSAAGSSSDTSSTSSHDNIA